MRLVYRLQRREAARSVPPAPLRVFLVSELEPLPEGVDPDAPDVFIVTLVGGSEEPRP